MINNSLIRVLIADDSFFTRNLIKAILAEESDIEVVGEATNGKEAVEKTLGLKPDVVIMDFNMSLMTGEEAAIKIFEKSVEASPIIMFSARTEDDLGNIKQSLRVGAVDYLRKPTGNVSIDIDLVRDPLLEKIRNAARAKVDKIIQRSHFQVLEKVNDDLGVEVKKVRVMIADDSFFVRSLVKVILARDPSIELVGEAKNGQEAVDMALELKPKVIIMDFNMPELDGKEATIRIFENSDVPPAIIMFSGSTKEGAEDALLSLKIGVFDFLAKPSGEVSINLDSIQDSLLEKIRVAALAKIRKPGQYIQSRNKKQRYGAFRPKVIVIGSSTGGPPVVEYILANLEANIKIPILVVQHMPEKFTGFFAERLNRMTPLIVKEAVEGDVFEPGHCYVAPGDWHLEIKAEEGVKSVHLTKAEPYLGLRPAINRTMESAVRAYGGSVLGVILTGMGNDGTVGIEAIKNAGGVAFAQSSETAVIDSMPSSIVKAGFADDVLTPQGITDRIIEFNNLL